MEDKKCCMGMNCGHKEGACVGKCCMHKCFIKAVLSIIALALVFCLGVNIGKHGYGNREKGGEKFGEIYNKNIKQESASGSVTIDVLPPPQEKKTDTKTPPVLE